MTLHYDIDWLIEKFESGDTLKYIFFWGHTNKFNEEVGKFCFSQWFESPFTINYVTYKTAEHWMMANKAMLFGDFVTFNKIILCDKPGEAKELGRQVLGYHDEVWNTCKFDIVKRGSIHKFNQHPELGNYLLKTNDRVLVEASPIDRIWGIGLSPDSADINNIYSWQGENLLGFALMEARDFLNEFGNFTPLHNPMKAPWNRYPNFDRQDKFWFEEEGYEYLVEFDQYFQRLNDSDKTVYILTNIEPFAWRGFYGKSI